MALERRQKQLFGGRKLGWQLTRVLEVDRRRPPTTAAARPAARIRRPKPPHLPAGALVGRRPGLGQVPLPRRSVRRPPATASPARRPARPFAPAQAQPPAATASARWTWSTPSFSGTAAPKKGCSTRLCVCSNRSVAAARNAVWGERLGRRLTPDPAQTAGTRRPLQPLAPVSEAAGNAGGARPGPRLAIRQLNRPRRGP